MAHNYAVLRNCLPPETKFMAVVGSRTRTGIVCRFFPEIEKLGADWIGVDSIVEATALRKEGIRVLFWCPWVYITKPARRGSGHNITLSVS